MKRLLFILAFIPFLGFSQTYDLSKEYNMEAIWRLLDANLIELTTNTTTNATNVALKSNTAGPTFTGVVDTPTLEVDSISFDNNGSITNPSADTLELTETAVLISGKLYINADQITADYAITDEQITLPEFWAKTQEINRLPAFDGVDRRNLTDYMTGLEESTERLLRYIIELEARIEDLEK